MKIISTLFLFLSLGNGFVQPKFCVECKNFIPQGSDKRFGKCKAFPIEKTNFFLVTKQYEFDEHDFRHCATARNLESLCGAQGKRFKPVDEEILQEIVFAR
jgi:hypothetical protein